MADLISVRQELNEFKRRYKWMALFVVVIFCIVLGRFVQLQLIMHKHYRRLAKENIARTITLPATRGIVRDARGQLIAGNRPSYDVFITPRLVKTPEVFNQFTQLMGMDEGERSRFASKLADLPLRSLNQRILMFSDISREQLAALSTHAASLRGVDVVDQPLRTYYYGTLAAHAIGYLNEVSRDDLKRMSRRGYHAGDVIGRSGIERAYERQLRGKNGFRRILVDARGHQRDPGTMPHEVIEKVRDPIPGSNLILTLDMDLMGRVKQAFREHASGALVAIEVKTGRIRALFSKPAYDLNEMTGRLTAKRVKEFDKDPLQPLIDKTLYATYYPGSIFKPFSAIAALQDQVLAITTPVECKGQYEVGNRRFRCSQKHGVVSMREALSRSCNIYFYRLGEHVGLDRLAVYAQDFGFGSPTEIGINTESKGFIPTRAWYEKHGQKFRVGFAFNAAIGQGDTRVTLLQTAVAYAALANGGLLYIPQLIEEIRTPGGGLIKRFRPLLRRRVKASAEILSQIREGLWGVVNDEKGTAYEARDPEGITVSGKTGTAQISHGKEGGKDAGLADYFQRDNAWFAGIAPAEDPELAVIVLVEHGGGGAKYAAPIAVEVLNAYLGSRE